MPKRLKPLRTVQKRSGSVVVRAAKPPVVIPLDKYPGKLVQVNPIRWSVFGTGRMTVEYTTFWAWLRGQTAVRYLELTLPAGTALSARKAGAVIGRTLRPMRVKVLSHKAPWIQLEGLLALNTRKVKLWVRQAAIQASTKPPALTKQWTNPTGRRLSDKQQNRRMVLRSRPGGKVLKAFTACNLGEFSEIRVVQKKKRWVKLWLKRGKNPGDLALAGWVTARSIRPRRPGKGSCMGGLSFFPALTGSRSVGPDTKRYWKVLRPMPIYLTPDPKATPVGVFTGKRLLYVHGPKGIIRKGAAQFLPVSSDWGKLYLPYGKSCYKKPYIHPGPGR